VAAGVGTPTKKSANLPSSACYKTFRQMPKHPRPDPTDEGEDTFSEVPSDDDQEPDIFAALTGRKKRRISGSEECLSEGDEDLQEIIRQATAKRDVREGTQVVKKAKGKTKITKGEVGGGSFQSMGERNPLAARCLLG
jgi:ATP-dependent RNA helicase DDX54/DBP10